jgi:hypothetical protein
MINEVMISPIVLLLSNTFDLGTNLSPSCLRSFDFFGSDTKCRSIGHGAFAHVVEGVEERKTGRSVHQSP